MLDAKHALMPKGPKGQKRPTDAASNAVRVMQIATGQIDDSATATKKNPAAVALGQIGGAARAASLTKKERTEIAKKGASARWKTKKRNRSNNSR